MPYLKMLHVRRLGLRLANLSARIGLGLVLFCESIPAKEAGSNPALVRQLNQAFVEVAERVSPAVVVVNVVQRVSQSDDENGDYEALPPGFWRDFHEQFKRPDRVAAQGSGIVIREDGFILTNCHVVEDADSINVRLKDGRTFKAAVRGKDSQSDVAVIKIEARGLPVATFADSARVRIGELAIAIGAPFGLDYSVTFGHVSAKSRSDVIEGLEAGAMDQDFLQTDALINPGNSGGPLVNIEGEVIGINTLIHGLHTGIGFAIPSNFAREVAQQLIEQGRFNRAWLGIGSRALRDDAEMRELLQGVDDGVIVAAILPEGPASKSDLKAGDVILSVEGERVSTPQQLRAAIRGRKFNQPVTLDLFRKGKTLKVKVSPGEWKAPSAIAANPKSRSETSESAGTGLTVQALTAELAARLNVDPAQGVVVATVEKNSAADRKGIKPGDLITAVNQQTVSAPQQFQEALKQADLKKGLMLNLQSGSTARFEILKIEP